MRTFDDADTSPHAKPTHATFVIECRFDAPLVQVFAAWADPDARARWFRGAPGEWQETLREHDFRTGGRECLVGRRNDGSIVASDARYVDIQPGLRIVFVCETFLDGSRISVSLATVELSAEAEGMRTSMRYTEQAAFLTDEDDAWGRECEMRQQFDRLAASLRHQQLLAPPCRAMPWADALCYI